MTWEKIVTKLLRPRTIFGFMVYLTLCRLAWIEKIEARLIMELVFIMTAFYYGERTGKKKEEVK